LVERRKTTAVKEKRVPTRLIVSVDLRKSRTATATAKEMRERSRRLAHLENRKEKGRKDQRSLQKKKKRGEEASL